jgi:dTDP-4-dehydrorhamnose 3,5-epimerase
MKFTELPLKGAFLVELDKREDERGFFARTYCEHEFADHGLTTPMVQANCSLSVEPHTLRGLHYQIGAAAEDKYIRCIRGRTHNVLVDMRPDSATFLQPHAVQLSSELRNALYVPRGFANGMMTLEPNAELFYMSSNFYTPEAERGVRWDDPRIGIRWPHQPAVLSVKDRALPDYHPDYHLGGGAGRP